MPRVGRARRELSVQQHVPQCWLLLSIFFLICSILGRYVGMNVFVDAFDVNQQKGEQISGDGQQQQQPMIDLNDPELVEAMEIFANMSPEEMEESIQELRAIIESEGEHDPETIAALEQVMDEIQKMSKNDIKQSLKNMIEEDEIAVAMHDALQLLQTAGDGAWDTIWEKRDLILQAVIESGKIDIDDAKRFQSNPKEWEAELKHIWNELQKQAQNINEEETSQQQQQQKSDNEL